MGLFFFFFNFSIVKMTRSLWNMYVKGIRNRARQGSSLLPFWGGWILWGNTAASTELWDQRCGVKIQPCWEPPGLVVRTWSFLPWPGFSPKLGHWDPANCVVWQEKKEIQRCWGSDQWQNPPTSWLSATALLFPNVYFTFCVYTQVRTSLLAERKRWCDCVCLKVNPTHCAMLPEAKRETALLPHLLLICPGPHFLALPPGQPLDQPTSLWTCKKRNLVLSPQN